jgi:hypothetical protein
VQGLLSAKRELVIIESFCEALKAECGKFVLPFRFRNENGSRTQHHLIFVSKHVLGYTVMKGIMARASSVSEQGVASFEYNPSLQSQGFLFELSRPLADLGQMLLDQFAGQTLTREKVVQQHHVGTPFIEKNYREVLLEMEQAGKIITDPPSDRRKANTMGKDVRITFPVEV